MNVRLLRRMLVQLLFCVATCAAWVGMSFYLGHQRPPLDRDAPAADTGPREPALFADPPEASASGAVPDKVPADVPIVPVSFTSAEPAGPDVKESFDAAKEGSLPTGWSGWSSETEANFRASPQKALSAPNGLTVTGGSGLVARAWLTEAQAADVEASAAVYLNTLIPAHVFVRGAGLNGATPTYYAATVARGLEVQLVRVSGGKETKLGSLKSFGYVSEKWVRLTIRAEGKNLRARVTRLDNGTYLDSNGVWQAAPDWALNATDAELTDGGQVGVGRSASYAGLIVFDDFAAAKPGDDPPTPAPRKRNKGPAEKSNTAPAAGGKSNATPATGGKPSATPGGGKPNANPSVAAAGKPNTTALPTTVPAPLPFPKMPRHYPHIRIAMLAYAGNPMGAFEDQLLRESVDLVVPNHGYLKHIHEIAPETPQLVYANTSNIYLELLTDWLQYADAHGLSREEGFYHAATPQAFKGDSPSSQPVTWFWGVYRGGSSPTNLTKNAHAKNGRVPFAASNDSLSIGYPDPFREINVELASPAGGGWKALLEYPTAVDGSRRPTEWAALATVGDTTNGLTQSGQVTFDPPAGWKTASVGGSAQLYYVRFRTTEGGSVPEAASILGRDFVNARGTTAGVVPAFDAQADRNQDGYLDDAEYARRKPGKDARFLYESRMGNEGYGQMRFCTNPSSPGFRRWAADFCVQLLAKHSLGGGLFMDNSSGRPPVKPAAVSESLTSYSADYGMMLQTISKTIAPRWVLANTAGGYRDSEPVIVRNPAYM
jgi:hypothetical protein